MEISEAIELIKGGVSPGGGVTRGSERLDEGGRISPGGAPEVWADLGCGSGLFTYALSTLLAPGSLMYAVDKSPVRLQYRPFPEGIQVETRQKDFTTEGWGLEPLDGVLMANSLHYVRDQEAFIRRMRPLLKGNGRYIVVEYDTDSANPWVPYPLSFASLGRLFGGTGYTSIRKLNERPSAFGRAMLYAAGITEGDL